MPNNNEAVEQALELIRVIDVNNAAIAMVERLGLYAEVHTTVGEFSKRGSVVGWTKQPKGKKKDMLVQVFVTSLDRPKQPIAPIPDDMVLVPRVATQEMLYAGAKADSDGLPSSRIWSAMIEASAPSHAS